MATIYCFTSTGNSLYTANTIADRIEGKVLPMREQPTTCEDDVIGFIFPCYFWGLPRMVERFIAGLQITRKNAYIFAVLTCGGQVFGALGLLKKILKSNHIQLRFAKKIISVSNYLPEYIAKDSEALRQKIDTQIHKISSMVINRETNWIPAITFLNKLIYKMYPDENCDRYFSVASTCQGCATCQKVCPTNNIEMNNGKPEFQHRCEHCLACLHNCPTGAIDWKNKTQGKKHYRNTNIRLEDLIAFNGR